MARKYRMHGLEGIKEDAMEVGAVGIGAVAGIFAAKSVGGFLGDMAWAKDLKDLTNPTDEQIKAAKPKTWAPYVIAAVPVAVGIGVVYAADKYNLKGAARSAAVGIAAGMVATAIGNVIIAAAPETAKTLKLAGLGASVDTYDTGLLAGLGEIDATVSAYMRRGLMGSPTQVERLISGQAFAGAPILVQPADAGMIGSPSVAQQLSGAPLSATLM